MCKCFRVAFFVLALPLFLPRLLAQNPTKPAGKSDYPQEAFVFEKIDTTVEFASDGTGVRDTDVRVRVQSEAGVQRFSVLTFPYQGSIETAEVPVVRVLKLGGGMVPTPPENIQDMASEITRQAPFYSDLREKHVAVRGLSAGDIIEYQWRVHVEKPLAPGQFWFDYSFFRDGIVLQEQLQISIPRERSIKFKSAGLKPTTNEIGGRRIYTWSKSTLEREPAKKDTLEADQQQLRGLNPLPDVLLTSFQTWEEVGRWYGGLQQDRVKPTQEIRSKAAELTKDAADDDAKLHAIYNYVSTQFHYIGIAFGIGRYQPHAASEVLTNQYGDCKDKHTLLASLLDAAGIKAYPALISSSHQFDPGVPTPTQFDHLISVVPRGSGLVWLDTTPEVAPFGYLVTALRDKQSLVILEGQGPALMTTPADPPFQPWQSFQIEAKLNDNGKLEATIARSIRGDDVEIALRTAFRRVPLPQWKELGQQVSYLSGFAGTVSEVTASPPEATSEAFHFSYRYDRDDYPDWQNHQISAPLPPIALPTLKKDETKPSAPIFLGSPGLEMKFQAKVQLPKGYTPELPAPIDLRRDFADYHSSYELQDGALIAKRSLVLKLREVPVAEYEDYKSFQKVVGDDHDDFIELSSGTSSLVTEMDAFRRSVWKLPDSENPDAVRAEDDAREAMRRGHWQSAIGSLQRAVARDPKFTRGWVLLGSLFSPTSEAAAVQAFHKAIDSAPGQPLPRKMLGYALMNGRKYELSIPVWEELIKLAPDDVDGPANLGMALFQLKRYNEAAAALEAAIKLDPERPGLLLKLGSTMLRAGDDKKALEEFQKAIVLEPGPEMLNNVAYELAEANQQLPLALDYSRQAVRGEEEASHDIRLDNLQMEDVIHTAMVGANWDTLGWVYFRMGDLEKAEKYLNAAWTLSQSADCGDHLGQVYERQQKKPAAIHTYALALAARDSMSETRARLVRLVGTSSGADTMIKQARGELSQLRTTGLTRLVPGSASADFFILLGPGPKVEDVKFVHGSEGLKSAEKALRATAFPVLFPDDGPTRLVRRGVLVCSNITGCSFVLLPPEAVHSVE